MNQSLCPDTEAICGFVEGRMGSLDRSELERHLDGCPSCRRAVVEVGRALDASRAALASGATPVSMTTDRPGGASRSVPPSSQRLSRYEIRREVAAGGMGVVYEGWDPALGRRLALKLMRPDLKVAGATEQLATEARALAKVSHPNVLTVFDVGIEGDSVFLAAEYIEGVTMEKGWPHRARSYRDRLDAYLQAARGLSAIHAAGLTHRDIKPTNILLGNDGRVRITDFGLAVREGQSAAPAGTPAYMAPEQIKGAPGPKADQFALAVCMVEALLGERVGASTKAEDLEKKAKSAWGGDPPPRALWVALATALAFEPDARHASVDAFIRAVEDATDRAPKRGARGTWIAATSVGAIAIIGVAAAAATGRFAKSPSAADTLAAAPNALTTTQETSAQEASAEKTSPTGEPLSFDEVTSDLATDSTAGGAPRARLAGSGAAKESAAKLSDGPPPGADTMTPLERAQKVRDHLERANKALTDRDGKKCLAELAEARALDPATVDSLTTLRAPCEMLAGKCDQGADRIAKDKNFGSGAGAIASQMRATYCPVDSGQSSPEERLKAVGFQAGAPPFTAAKCAQHQAQAAKAIKDHGSKKPDATAVSIAQNNVAMCWAWVGDCGKAAAIIGSMVPPSDDRDEKIKKWVRQAHPNCASFGN